MGVKKTAKRHRLPEETMVRLTKEAIGAAKGKRH